MRRHFPLPFLNILLVSAIFFISLPPIHAQEDDELVEYRYGEILVIKEPLPNEGPIQEVQIFLRGEGESETLVSPAIIEQDRIVYSLDLSNKPLRAFSRVEYWFQIISQEGKNLTTEPKSFYYEDNRFQWESLDEPPFRVHWYTGEINFAQSVLDVAQVGLQRSKNFLNLPTPGEIDIYIYDSSQALQSTLRLSGLHWVAGHADADLGVMVVSLPPGPDQRLEIERQVPHELMHILLYEGSLQTYLNIPTWFREGLASLNELKPNPDYYVILNSAVEKETLIPMNQLCNTFPVDTAGIYQAYAQSASFTRYLHQTYGVEGFEALLDSYNNGLTCERGVEAALGVTLTQLERDWRQETFGENAAGAALEKSLPWIMLLCISLIVPVILTVISMKQQKYFSSIQVQ